MEASYKKIPKASNFPDYKKEVNVRPRRVHDQALMSDDMLDPLLVTTSFFLRNPLPLSRIYRIVSSNVELVTIS